MIRSTFGSDARKVYCVLYRQKEDTVSAGELDLHATDLIHVRNDFSLTRDSLISTVKRQGKPLRKTIGLWALIDCVLLGGSVVIVPEDQRFEGWDFVHYKVSGQGEERQTTTTFVQTTISEGQSTQGGYWTVDSKHAKQMKQATSNNGVVGMVLKALEVPFTDVQYNNEEEVFKVTTTSKTDVVKFVLITSCVRPTRTGPGRGDLVKFAMQNLALVFRPDCEKSLGLSFVE